MITFRGEQVVIVPLDQPAAPDLVFRGATGSTTYSYKVVARHTTGHSEASLEASITTGTDPLGPEHYIQITPPYVQGAQLYDIYRTVGGPNQGKLGTLVPTFSGVSQLATFPDYGQDADLSTPPDTNTTGLLYLPGIEEDAFLQVDSGGLIVGTTHVGSSIAFTDLSDTLTDYTGVGGELIVVNGTEDGLDTLSVGDLITSGQAADSTHKGFLTAANWVTFNAKQDALGYTPENVANKSTTTSLGSSNTLYPTQNAVKTYVDTGLGTKEDVLGYTPENVANKSTSTSLGTSNTLYPTQNAVKAYADAGLALKQPLQGTHLALLKQTSGASAPGDGVGMLRWEAGTDSGTLKLVAYSGTDVAGVTIVDNVGSGNT